MRTRAVWDLLRTSWRTHRAELRFCLRVTAAAILALLVSQAFALPLQGLWVVLTATVVTQLSIGGSLRAALEYFLGTLGGAVYAGLIGLLVPHKTEPAQIAALAVTIVPLACAAAVNPNFRVAPFSAVLVLLISGQLGEGPVESALIRVLEVTLGGAVAVIVSLLVFPEGARQLAREAAARVLDAMADGVPKILAGFRHRYDETELQRIQDRIGRLVSDLQEVVEETRRERPVTISAAPDPAPLARTLLRLRHDFVMIGRASAEPLPADLSESLMPALERASVSISSYLHACALALRSRQMPPPARPLRDELCACASQIAALRNRDLVRLSARRIEQWFALGFALEQLRANVQDLERCVEEWSASPSRPRSKR